MTLSWNRDVSWRERREGSEERGEGGGRKGKRKVWVGRSVGRGEGGGGGCRNEEGNCCSFIEYMPWQSSLSLSIIQCRTVSEFV